MASDDEWKDGVPPLPPGVSPASSAPTAWTPGPTPVAPVGEPGEPGEPVAQPYGAVPYGAAPAAPPSGLPLPPPPGPGWYPPPAPIGRSGEKNWMGIVALIFGIIGGWVLALIFGLLSLNAYKQGKANNRGFAIGGLAAAGGWLVFSALIFAAAGLFGGDSDEIPVTEAQVGDCFTSTLEVTENIEEGYYSFSQCSDESNGIVYYVTAADASVSYSDPTFDDTLYGICTSDVAVLGVDRDLAYYYYIEYYVPSVDEWNNGIRTVVCGLSTDGDLNYDVLTDAEPNVAN